MKNIIFLRFFAILIASAVFISCSKEKLTPALKQSETISTVKMWPDYNYGGIAGAFTPAPYSGILKFYHENGTFVTSCNTDENGFFKHGELIPGTYRIMLRYIPNYYPSFPGYEYRYFEMQGVRVEEGVMRDLGDIRLPK